MEDTYKLTDSERQDIVKVLETLTEVVRYFGENYVYPASHRKDVYQRGRNVCQYVHEGKPDCIAGQVLHRLGISIDALSGHEGESVEDFETELLCAKALGVLLYAQNSQDVGGTWGRALETAKNKAKLTYGIEI